jgi:hypothetical protein
MGEFFKNPIACLTLASYLITNTGGTTILAVLLLFLHSTMLGHSAAAFYLI